MRYSVPLVRPATRGLRWTRTATNRAITRPPAIPKSLAIVLQQQSSERWLEVRNQRRSACPNLESDAAKGAAKSGLMGYVLPGSQMRFALPPAGGFSSGKLMATVNDNKQPVAIPSY